MTLQVGQVFFLNVSTYSAACCEQKHKCPHGTQAWLASTGHMMQCVLLFLLASFWVGPPDGMLPHQYHLLILKNVERLLIFNDFYKRTVGKIIDKQKFLTQDLKIKKKKSRKIFKKKFKFFEKILKKKCLKVKTGKNQFCEISNSIFCNVNL